MIAMMEESGGMERVRREAERIVKEAWEEVKQLRGGTWRLRGVGEYLIDRSL